MKKNKELSLLRQLIIIRHEQALRRKAIRIMEKQSWSMDFLSALLVRAGKTLGTGVQLTIENKDGQKVTLTYQKAEQSVNLDAFDMDIFNQLDNDVAVAKFIREHSTR